MIIFNVYKNGGKIKKINTSDDRNHYTFSEIKDKIDANPERDFKFIDVNTGKKDITGDILLRVILKLEERNVK